ncbi:EAL domain-containing protein [Paraburkholderia unamae]|nr:EAL domain-containing protein [Paraburkholderia unamae]
MERRLALSRPLRDRDLAPVRGDDSNTQLVEGVFSGLRNREFTVAFQPIVHAKTGALWSVECLLRWKHPDYGTLLPGAFADALRDPEVGREIFFFVLASACCQFEKLRCSGRKLQRIAINIQPSLLTDDSLGAAIAEIATRHDISPSFLELELVETEDAATLLATRHLTAPIRELGIRLSLDDFGTGFSSLSALCSMRIDTVKLARDFMKQIPELSRSCDFVAGILDVLKIAGMTVVVEGVENEAQLNWLSRRDEVYVQGFYIARPAPTLADALLPWRHP